MDSKLSIVWSIVAVLFVCWMLAHPAAMYL